ncbi:hypothetical protein Q0F99_14480 [Rathayibacter oskolensis]|uniref:hypothetical protein n=1 Tax=Rathayibacter oskolensis TaxID=1891671 RepID=UPI00265D8745|nr:hypothetical protein [Rathayibacter oskolensis]WKK73423.1 hypothetical protein Q0F99_14480 [Rathayibacter oskolensis]
MIECGSCGTDALVLDRSGAGDADDLVVLCAECAPGELTGALEAALLDGAILVEAVPLEKSAHARAA